MRPEPLCQFTAAVRACHDGSNPPERERSMYRQILVPIDLGSPELNKPAMETATMMAGLSQGTMRLVNVLPLTPVMLAEYVPPDFELQQRKAAEEALAIIVREAGLEPSRISATVRQGGIYQEILEEANSIKRRSHRDDVAPAAPARDAHLLPRLQCRPRGALRQLLGPGREKLKASVTAAGRASPAPRPAGNGRASFGRRTSRPARRTEREKTRPVRPPTIRACATPRR